MFCTLTDNTDSGERWRKPLLSDPQFLLAALGLLAARMLFYQLTGFTTDDAFITYRYARNLAGGLGFVYNIGEKVQGTSSPLYTLWLAAVATVTGPDLIPIVSRITGLAADLVTLRLLWIMIPAEGTAVRWFAAVVLILFPKINLIGISGMEAPVVTMLMLLSWHLLLQRRSDAALFVCSLLLLTRLDSALWIGLLIVLHLVRGERIPWRAAILPALLYGAWILFCQLYFGSWMPHSVTAKNVSWSHLFPAFDPLRIMLGYLPFSAVSSLPGWAGPVLALLIAAPAALEGALLYRERSPWLVFPLFFLLYNLLYSFGRVIIPDWYYYPGYIVYTIVIASLLLRMERSLRPSVRARAAYAPAVALALLLAVGYHLGAQRWADNPGGLFLRQNQALGLWLRQHAPADASVLAEPIGFIGWESNLYIHDYIGLVSPHIVAARKQNPLSDRWYSIFLQEHRPSYIVQRSWELPGNRLFHGRGDGLFVEPEDRQWFLDHYLPVSWNPRAAETDSVYLVLFELTEAGPLYGALR